MTDPILVLIILLVWALIGLAAYAWYGFALSRLFPKLGAEGWKGWVPVLNEIEIFVRGGAPAWSVVFLFIPFVQIYGIYLKAMAVHRINESFGKGAGYTVLGIVLPPLWATLLVSGRMPAAGDYDRRVEGLMTPPTAAPAGVPGPDALGGGAVPPPPAAPARTAAPPHPSAPPYPAAPAYVAAPPYASAPPPPPAAPVPVEFPAFATSPEPVAAPSAPSAPPPPPAPAPVMLPPEPVGAPPAPPITPAAPVHNPWAQGPAVPPAVPVVEPVAVDAPDDDEFDRTVVVDRRPIVPWRLVTDEGHVAPLRTKKVLLGRKPVSSAEGVDVVAVPDSTKTLSKNHARLELSDDGRWTIFDLDSTNGVIVIEPDGTETLLPQGGSALVPGRFMLGKVAMRISFDDVESTR